MSNSFIRYILAFTIKLEKFLSFLIVARLVIFISFGYSTGVMGLQFALYIFERTFIALVYSKAIFRFFRFRFPKIKLILNSINLSFPLFLVFSVWLFGSHGGLLVIALELAQVFGENPEPEELEESPFNGIEQEDPETETQVEEVELKKERPDRKNIWFGVALLIAVKVAILIWFS